MAEPVKTETLGAFMARHMGIQPRQRFVKAPKPKPKK